jgi:tetratricopeptide (TPR) repeat protein
LSGQPAILFNLAQAQRKQFKIDNKLERLARAEEVLIAYRREGAGEVTPEVIEQVLTEIREQRAEYHRKREAEARTSEPPAMREARQHYERGEPADALASLEKAERVEGNARIVLLQIYRLRGQAAAQAGKPADAIEAFKKYLALEPAADGTGLNQEAEAPFAEAKKFWNGRQPLTLEHLPPGKVAPGKSVTIPVKIASDPLEMVKQRELRYRRQGFDEWETVSMAVTVDAAKLPPAPMPITGKSYRMEYYVDALDEHRGVLDSIGTAKAPLAFLVTKDAIVYPTPLYKKWWVWTAAVTVVAGGVATYFIITDDGLPDLDLASDVSDLGVLSW